jgi:hypothetical protein
MQKTSYRTGKYVSNTFGVFFFIILLGCVIDRDFGDGVLMATLTLISFSVSFLIERARKNLPLEYINYPLNANLANGALVDFSIVAYYPPDAPEDEVRFNLPTFIKETATTFLSQCDQLPDSLELEKHLVFLGRKWATHHHIHRIDIKVNHLHLTVIYPPPAASEDIFQ